ncbi:disulfide oxidoreductase [Desertibacillus haloalkaliphilus]|uniref:disulfide oxidoreductase n=1 Tax=Desertibacillus haloalkaliphilus TaxID=1328930 RepID=UPI001C25B510|nr:disulfide oxidoreductase [Desertibacillus haloalkaliphilus]MBU8905011.1 disulfide bond formation protein B [Desertibacillus haloalkaliphilus]
MNANKKMEGLLFISWAIAVVATAGSLYFSEVMRFTPCELCWVQRIFMYPLAIILAIAVIRKDMMQSIYVSVLSFIGACIAFYHYLQQKVSTIGTDDSCGLIPCTFEYINWFGFITIPFLSLVAFIVIFIIHVVLLINVKKEIRKS